MRPARRASGRWPVSVILAAALLAAGFLPPALIPGLLAQEPGGEVHELPGIWVGVRRSLLDAGLARSVERLRPDEELVPFRDLGHWLSTRSSSVVRRYGGGGRQVLSVRGDRPEGVLVLLDGLPLNDPLTGVADLSSVPLASLESATLVRGAGGARYGSGALGGVLVLRSAGSDVGSSARLGFGSFGAREASGALRTGALRLGAGLRSAANDYTYENRLVSGSPELERENADSESRWFHVSGLVGDHRLHLRYDDLDRGVPGRLGTNAFRGDRWSQSRWSLGSAMAGESWTLRTAARHLAMRYAQEGNGAPSEQEAFDARVSGELVLPALHHVVAAGRLSVERLSGDGIQGTPGRVAAGLSVRRTFGDEAYGAPAGSGDGFGAEPVLALDVSEGEAALSPELGAWYRFGGGADAGTSRVFGRIGRAYRLPTFADLHFEAAPGVRARPDLEAERVVLDAELGVAVTRSIGPGDATARLSAWRRDTRQPIVWLASSVAVWSPRNLDRLEARGFDLDLRFDVQTSSSASPGRHGWAVEVGASLQDSRVGFGSNRNPLPYQPDVTARLAAEMLRGPVALRLGASYTGSRTTSLAATRRLEGFVTVDAGLVRRFGVGGLTVDASLDVENVFAATYEMVELYPEPRRSVRVTLDFH